MVPTFIKRMEPFFTLRKKPPLQIIQIILIIAVIALSGARLLLPNRPPGRSTTMGLGMGAKSLIIISYELLPEHVNRFRRWRSLKAYFILNAMEVVFWAAVAFMMIRGNSSAVSTKLREPVAFQLEEGKLSISIEGHEAAELIQGDVVFVPGNISFTYHAVVPFTRFLYVSGGKDGFDQTLMEGAQAWDHATYPVA